MEKPLLAFSSDENKKQTITELQYKRKKTNGYKAKE